MHHNEWSFTLRWELVFYHHIFKKTVVSKINCSFSEQCWLLIFHMRLYSSQFPDLLRAYHTSQPYCQCIEPGGHATHHISCNLLKVTESSIFSKLNCHAAITVKFCTAVLLWHVQNFASLLLQGIELHLNVTFILNFNCEWKLSSEMVPRLVINHLDL